MSHTPGPWKVLGEDVVLECNEKEVVAWVGDIDGQMINNAHLIAAAPDMLEALETIMDIGDKACRDIARAAIRKARGDLK